MIDDGAQPCHQLLSKLLMGRRSQFGSPQFGLLHVPQPPRPTSIAINELRPPGAHLNFPSASIVPKHFFLWNSPYAFCFIKNTWYWFWQKHSTWWPPVCFSRRINFRQSNFINLTSNCMLAYCIKFMNCISNMFSYGIYLNFKCILLYKPIFLSTKWH